MYLKILKAIKKELKRLYRKSKNLNDTDRDILTYLTFYLVGLVLLPLCIFTYFDKQNIIFLIFIPLVCYLIFSNCINLRKYETRLVEMSKNFKYYVKHKLILLATIYWTGEY